MSDFSRLPQAELKHAQDERYVGIYFKQGVPILDRDLNLLQDLVATTVRSIVSALHRRWHSARRRGIQDPRDTRPTTTS